MIIGTFSKGIFRQPLLPAFFGASKVVLRPGPGVLGADDIVVGWGRKRNTRAARRFAASEGVPYVVIEDGFVRSVGLGREGAPSLSLVVDTTGIYFDSRTESSLEQLLNDDSKFRDPVLMSEADEAMCYIRDNKLSKYNGFNFDDMSLPTSRRDRVLVIDQVKGDASLLFGMRQPFDLYAMVKAACKENPDASIYVKLHPETVAGFRKGGCTGLTLPPDVHFITEDVNPIALLEQVDKVYVATSLMGFEALMLGKEVVCFGMPFYAGWGVTDDREVCPRRTRQRTVREIFAAAYILYSRYVNPHTGKRCDIMTALRILKRQVDHERARKRNIFCFGIRHWKRYNVLPFLRSRHNRVVFTRSVDDAVAKGIRAGDEVVVWGAREPAGLDRLLAITGTPLLRMEDGFLRSVGLGSDFAKPSSLVLDPDGIYFDPERPSRLEKIIQAGEFGTDELEMARRVREKLLAARLSKYNHQTHLPLDLSAADGKRVVFIPGQVADDASLAKGCVDVADNTTLIRTVRESNPDAFIVYKPHPDVTSGNRKGKVSADVLAACCDLVVERASIPDCLECADEVHTMTSLVGFEALMRGIPVHVYGRPFYAGWGLTNDRHPIPRRTRPCTLDELVAAALLRYPEYYDWDAGMFCDAETVIDRLAEQRRSMEEQGRLRRLDPGYIERQVRKMILIIKGLRYAE